MLPIPRALRGLLRNGQMQGVEGFWRVKRPYRVVDREKNLTNAADGRFSTVP